MVSVEQEIEETVNRETLAWETKDVELLLSVFHPDIVWPWPMNTQAHNPVDWVLEMGRYDYKRWKESWQRLFDTHTLAHNNRKIKKIVVSKEEDGAFAVVDVDTLWIDSKGNHNHWKGRACKVYTKMGNQWKLIMHTGLLDYATKV
jgi:ketosteroid isomerase-like protein